MGLNYDYNALAMESVLVIVIVTLSSTMDVGPAIEGPRGERGMWQMCPNTP